MLARSLPPDDAESAAPALPGTTDAAERAVPSVSAPPLFTRRERILGYVALTKPRIIELLLVTTVPTMVVADRGLPSLWLVIATVIGGTLSAGGANAVNMYVDRDIDRLMVRTQQRPLVRGVMAPRNALAFAVGVEAASFVWLWGFVNLLSAGLALAACLFYVFVYTLWLKRTSKSNIVIGGAAGAAPVLIGWSAVTNDLAWPPVVLFALVFFWTPPHFWALAIKYRDDYAAASVPMLPVVASLRTTTRKIVVYTVVLWAVSLVFAPVADMGALYWASAVVLGGVFLVLAIGLARRPTTRVAMQLFGYSITYLIGSLRCDGRRSAHPKLTARPSCA